MSALSSTEQSDPWEALRRYRQRYGGEIPATVDRLEARLNQRKARANALKRRSIELEKQLEETTRELTATRSEIEGTNLAAALLVEELLGEVRQDHGEVWSPTPVLGFRVWLARDKGLVGAKTIWPKPELRAICLNRSPGDDLPHAEHRCGPPACGIYATKEIGVLRRELGVSDSTGYVIGLVAMTGKVIEHTRGYRGAHASVVAIAANFADRLLLSEDPDIIFDLFQQPQLAIQAHGAAVKADESHIDSWLNLQRKEHDKWIWAKS